jgi:hypothetical protein
VEKKMKNTILTKAEDAAKRFIERLRSGKIKKYILPDNSEEFTVEDERKEYEHFLKFSETEFYKKLVEM